MSRTPIHPGKILRDELKEIGITGAELSRLIKAPKNRIPQIITGEKNISADTAPVWVGVTISTCGAFAMFQTPVAT